MKQQPFSLSDARVGLCRAGWLGSLALLLLCFGTVLPLRSAITPVFPAEAITVLLLCVASWAFARTFPVSVPAIAAVGVFTVVVLVNALWGAGVPSGVTGMIAYASVFVLASILGLSLGENGVLTFSLGLVLCATAQGLLGVCQLFGWGLGGLVVPKQFNQVYGNVAQANHYADLVWLGISGLLYRFSLGRIAVSGFVPLLLLLVFVSAASASRGVWLYVIAYAAVAIWVRAKLGVSANRLFWGLAATVVSAVLVQIGIRYGHWLDGFGIASSVSRMSDVGSNGQRLYDWGLALSAMREHPWLGVGIGGFHRWAIIQMPFTADYPFSKFAEHAHNLPLHVAATMGVPFAIACCVFVVWTLLRALRGPVTNERVFGLCGLSVIGLHSMVEYPLWYAYFLVPAGVFWGIVSANAVVAKVRQLPAIAARTLSTIVLVGLGWALHDFSIVERVYTSLAETELSETPRRASLRFAVERIPAWSLFGDHAASLALQAWSAREAESGSVAAKCELAFGLRPSWGLGTQCMHAMAMAGDRDGLQRMSLVMCEGFARYHRQLSDWARRALPKDMPAPLDSFECFADR